MKKVFFAGFFVLLFVFAITVSAEKAFFKDVTQSDENYEAISFLYDAGIIEGYQIEGSDLREFLPEKKINRAEFLTLILENSDYKITKQKKQCFPDVPIDSWYQDAVCFAKAEGIIHGYVDGNFKPNNTITEVEVLKILGVVDEWEVYVSEKDEFWYTPYMNFALEKKFIDETQGVTLEVNRGDIAEILYRNIVVDKTDAKVYKPAYIDVIDSDDDLGGDAFVDDTGVNDDSIADITVLGLEVDGVPVEDLSIDFDAVSVALVSFQGKPKGDREVLVKNLTLHNLKESAPYGLKRIYVKDADGEVVFDSGYGIKLHDWLDDSYLISFDDYLVFEQGQFVKYTIFGDFDWEIYDGSMRFGFFEDDDFMTDYDFVYLNNVVGPTISRNNLELEEGDYSDLCALWDSELNRPYIIGQVGPDGEPLERGEVINPPDDAHKIKPINQEQRPICLAASVYSSLRWFEERFNLENLIENGLNGLDELVGKLYGPDKKTAVDQLDALVEHVNKKYPGCIDIDYNTQAGFNVTCNELLEYNKKKCDVPIQFTCQAFGADGKPLPGDEGKTWAHGVDLVSVEIDPNDSDQCTLTFANSWSDPANPGEDMDGLGAGRYEKAKYNDDTESFTPELPWAEGLKCNLFSAVFMCIDQAKCK